MNQLRIVAVLVAALLWQAASGLTFRPAMTLEGSWRGDLVLGSTSLPIVLNFHYDADSVLMCTLDSPAQGARGIGAVALAIESRVSVMVPSIGAAYMAEVTDSAMVGTFSQGGLSLPLTLVPQKTLAQRRPQTPKPPFPYTTVDTAIAAPDGASLAATLTIPHSFSSGSQRFVVMVTGSGPQNRDEEVADHRPFAVIADWLARHGIASLRYDDRGVGQSTGDFAQATTADFLADALSAVDWLRTYAPHASVGILGHSEGGTIAFMAAAEGRVDFIISLAGMASTGRSTLLSQLSHSFLTVDIPQSDSDATIALADLVYRAMADQWVTGQHSSIDVDSIAATLSATPMPEAVQAFKELDRSRSPWFMSFVALDPSRFLARVQCPVLAVGGELDVQVDVSDLDIIRSLVPSAEILRLSGVNHLMQHCRSGEVDQYEQIEQTIAPEVLEAIVEFVNRN